MTPKLTKKAKLENKAKLDNFKEHFKDLLSKEVDKNVDFIEKTFKNLKKDYFLAEYKKNWHKAHKVALLLFSKPEEAIFTSPGWEEVLSNCHLFLVNSKIDNSTTSLVNQTSSIHYVSILLVNILEILDRLAVPFSREFENSKTKDKDALNALTSFIDIGQKIRSDKAYYAKSNTKKLEDVLLDRQDINSKYFKAEAAARVLNLSTYFVALAAPSMEGKTQSAFVFNRVRPLYFPLSQVESDDENPSQPIYENFDSFANELFKCAVADMKRLNATITSTSFLNETHADTQFITLGFLKALADESRNVPNRRCWMKHYANITKLSYSSASINETIDSFKGIVLMLDEFTDWDEFIFVRNLAGAAGLTCLVANTNIEIAHFVEKPPASGSLGPTVWSLVVTRLDSASLNVLNQKFDFSGSIDSLIGKRKKKNDSICQFLRDLKSKHIHHLRPGVALFVAQILKDMLSTDAFAKYNLGQFMYHLGNELRRKLFFRKNLLAGSSAAFLGHVGLLLPESYSRDEMEAYQEAVERHEQPGIEIGDEFHIDLSYYLIDVEYISLYRDLPTEADAFRQPRLIEKHLFYITNPVNAESNWFLTFPPMEGEKNSDSRPPLTIWLDGTFSSWNYEYSHFDADEFLTILACHMIRMFDPVSKLLIHAHKELKTNNEDAAETINIKAVELDGNCLDVTAVASLAKASHRSVDQTLFSGTKGKVFIKNLIYQMIVGRYPLRNGITLCFDAAKQLLAALNDITVPFIYGLNHENCHFKELSASDPSFFVQNYQRTSNSQQIDGIFYVRDPQHQLLKVVCECQNYAQRLGSKMIKEILERVRRIHPDSPFCFIFCNDAVIGSTALSRYCRKAKINVYRVVRSEKHHSIIPFWSEFVIHPQPTLNCILFETLSINFYSEKF